MKNLPIVNSFFLVGMYEPPTADDWLVEAPSKEDAIDKVIAFLKGKHANRSIVYSKEDFMASEPMELLR